MICEKFGLNWSSGSGEDKLNFFNVFLLFCYYLPLEKQVVLQLNKLESPSTYSFRPPPPTPPSFKKFLFKLHQCIFAIS